MALKAASRGRNRSDAERLGFGRFTAMSAPRPGRCVLTPCSLGLRPRRVGSARAAEVLDSPDKAPMRDRHGLGADRRVHHQVRPGIDPPEFLGRPQAVAKALVVEVAAQGRGRMVGPDRWQGHREGSVSIDGGFIVPVHALIRFVTLQPVPGTQCPLHGEGVLRSGQRQPQEWQCGRPGCRSRGSLPKGARGSVRAPERVSSASHGLRLSPPLPPLCKGGMFGYPHIARGGEISGDSSFFPPCEGGTQGGALDTPVKPGQLRSRG